MYKICNVFPLEIPGEMEEAEIEIMWLMLPPQLMEMGKASPFRDHFYYVVIKQQYLSERRG